MTQYLPEVEAIAREAGALLMGYFASHVTIEYKGDVDLVTEADRASEKMIVERLRSRWPEHGIVGEEGARSGPAADHRWYVDPLDGTTNFAHGYPVFCVRSEEHTSELQSLRHLVCRLLLEKKK